MLASSVSYKRLVQLVFVFSLFVSTDAVVGFLIAGGDTRLQGDIVREGNAQLRMLFWLPSYLFFTCFSVLYFTKIYTFFINNFAFLSVIVLCIVSSLWSGMSGQSIYSSLQLALLTCFAIVVGSIFSLDYVLKQIYLVFCSIIVLSFFTVVLLPEYGISFYAGEEAFRGVFSEKNRLGQILVYYFCFSFAFFKRNFIGLAIFAMACFLLLGNRSATALVLTMLLPIFYHLSKLFYGEKRIVFVNSFVVFILLFVATVIIVFTYEYVLLLLGKDPTLTGRTVLWEHGFDSFLDKPLLGYGYNSFWKLEEGLGGGYIRMLIEWGPMSMHNGWFETILQLGLVGLLLALYLFFQLIGLTVSTLNLSKLSKPARVVFLFVVVYFVWTQMQHLILRHQEFTHYIFTVLFSSLFVYKNKLQNKREDK
jgi:O-antigen ligase